VLGALALGAPGAAVVAWVALVPLFVALDGAGSFRTLALAIVYAVVLGLGGLGPWLSHAAAAYFGIGRAVATGYVVVFLATIFTLHGTLLGLLLLGRPGRVGAWNVVWCAAAWAIWDAVRTGVFPRFPGGVLALSQHAALPVLQIASVTGVAGVSFILVAGNAGVAALVTDRSAAPRVRLLAVATGIGLAGAATLWGALRIGRDAGAASSTGPTVISIDVNAADRAASTLERYLATSEEAVATPSALLVWPESALPTDPEHDRAAWTALSRFVATHGVPLLAGGPGTGLVRPGPGIVNFNSAHLIAPGSGLRTYHKRQLVPFAERWPSFLGAPPAGLAPDLAGLEPGDVLGVFPLGDGAFGVLICFEITDAAAARALAARGARFIVNLTNDAWFESAPHLPWAAIRAVETGVPVVRAANAGVSAVFDRLGRARPRRGAGWLVTQVPPAAPTVYVRRGEVFLGACLALLLAGLLRAVLAR
jgi:apolipoprotein N-acyltransferase